MRRLDWNWLWWQVGLPFFRPVILSGVFALFWWSLEDSFAPQVRVLVDLTPWALATYSLTLIGSALRIFWPQFLQRSWLGAGLIAIAVADTIYYAFMILCVHGYQAA